MVVVSSKALGDLVERALHHVVRRSHRHRETEKPAGNLLVGALRPHGRVGTANAHEVQKAEEVVAVFLGGKPGGVRKPPVNRGFTLPLKLVVVEIWQELEGVTALARGLESRGEHGTDCIGHDCPLSGSDCRRLATEESNAHESAF